MLLNEHEVTFNCNETFGVRFFLKSMNNVLCWMFFWIMQVYNFLTKSDIVVYR